MQGTLPISRVLSNPLINPLSVMQGFIPEITQMMAEQGQTEISDGFGVQEAVLDGCPKVFLSP